MILIAHIYIGITPSAIAKNQPKNVSIAPYDLQKAQRSTTAKKVDCFEGDFWWTLNLKCIPPKL